MSCSAPAPVYTTLPAPSSTPMYELVGAWYARTAAPFASNSTGNGSGAAARWRLIEAGVSFTPTPTARNVTLPPYVACAALSDGSSALHSGHQVAQNSSTTGWRPMYWPRSTDLPSRSSTATTGAFVPTARPTSCAPSGDAAASASAAPTRNMYRITTPSPLE